MYVFEISVTADQGYMLQMWQTRPEDWPLLIWENEGYTLNEAKGQAERLAAQRVPFIIEG